MLTRALGCRKWDRFIFLGDACDNFGATQEDNIQIIKLLIETKKKYGDKFIWLIGNHDWGYYDDSVNMTGHIIAGSSSVEYLLKENREMWDLFFCDGKRIYSHAGISLSFIHETSKIPAKELKENIGVNNPMNNVGFACGGYSSAPSLIWARPDEIEKLPLDDIQIVGHTPVEKITAMKEKSLVICDTMSQYKDGSFIGDQTLLFIDDKDNMFAINPETGRKKYEIFV